MTPREVAALDAVMLLIELHSRERRHERERLEVAWDRGGIWANSSRDSREYAVARAEDAAALLAADIDAVREELKLLDVKVSEE